MKLRPATRYHLYHAERALALLIDARESLQIADCPKALERVQLAISSAKGALRHVERRARSSQEAS